MFAHDSPERGPRGGGATALQRRLIERFDRGGRCRSQLDRVVECIGKAVVARDEQDSAARQRREPEVCGGDDGEGSLGAAEQGGRVDQAVAMQPIDAIATEAACQLGKAEVGRSLVGADRQVEQFAPQFGTAIGAAGATLGLGSRHRFGDPGRPIDEHAVEAVHMAMRPTMNQRPLARSIGRDHPADRGAVEG